MEKRKIIIGTYDTVEHGQWTLTGWTLSRAAAMESYVDIPGHSGPLDLSTALTDGEPYYGSREFTATLETSEGSRLEREQRINDMINNLDGWRHNIVLPDDPTHYITGRIRVEKVYNDPAHAAVLVTAICDPWRYNFTETVVTIAAAAEERVVVLTNEGRRSVVPRVKVTDGDVRLKYIADTQELTWALMPGEYTLGDIYLKSGTASLTYSGVGKVTFTYREAVL